MKYLPLVSELVAILVIGMMLVSGCVIGDGERDSAMPRVTPTPQIIYVTVLVTPTLTTTIPTTKSGDNTPLMIVVKGNGNYNSRDTLTFSGIGPKGQLVSISLTESTGITYYSPNVATINDDGTWSYNFDLKTIPIARGQTTVQASVPESTSTLGSNINRIESSPIILNILP